MRKFMLAALTLCLVASSVLAQSSFGNLSGTVTDEQGGTIAGATIVIRDNQTGRERTVVSREDGVFRVPQLEVGTYTVRVTSTGYKTFVANEVKIDVGREYSLNAQLQAGGVQEEVTVVAGADVLNATTAELSNTVTGRQITDLPLNGRNPLTLITLQAGTASNGATNTAINGQRTSFTNITRDGINIQDNFIRANATDFAPQRPGVDDISEFTLTTSNADASQGYGASQVQLVTPRGQSEFHGAAFIFNRNSELASNTFLQNAAGTARPFLNRNQFGGKIGGPLPLPRFGEGGASTYRNKGFFFFNYEGFRERKQSSTNKTILLPQARQGVFTYVDNSGTPRSIDLLSTFGSRFGVAGINPIVQSRILDLIPTAGNNTEVGDQRNTTGFRLNVQNNIDRDNYTARFDVDANTQNSFKFIYSHGSEANDRPDQATGFTPAPLVVQPATRDFLSTGWRWTPGASFTNELSGGFFISEPVFNRTTPQPEFFLTLPLISNPETSFQDQGRKADIYTIANNANYIRGDHSFRFGGSINLFRTDSFAAFDTIPRYTLGTGSTTPALAAADFPGGISTAQLNAANSLVGLLGGVVSRVDQTFNATNRTSGFVPGATFRQIFDFENYGLYFTDQWRVSPRLTLNLGVRYELYTALRERNGFGLEPVLGSNDPLASILNPNGTVGFLGNNASDNRFYNTDKNNIAPIVSFAWTPNFTNRLLGAVFGGEGRTVIRGGYRISYVNDEFIRAPDNAQGGNSGLSTSVAFLRNQRLGGQTTVATPAFGIPRTFAEGNAISGINFGTVFAIDPNLEVPMTQEWNFGIQREIGFQTAIEIRYVGGKSDNLVRGIDFNEVNIFDTGFVQDFNRARANLVQFGNPACSAAQAASTGCQQLTVFPNLGSGGLLNNTTIRNQLLAGTPADLAIVYVQNALTGSVQFLPNPNAGVVDLLTNVGKYRYHALQTELRRRFTQGFHLQANYTFQKTLTNASGVGQTNFEPNLSNRIAEIEYARADYDSTHNFNLNTIYELPFGRGKRWLNEGGVVDRIFGGFQIASIIQASTGAPLTITDPRGTFNRAGRSTRQTPETNLTKDQIKDLIGVFRTPCGVFYINPSVINLNQQALAAGDCGNVKSGSFTGQGALGFGQPTFPGQVFFNVAPGQTSDLERAFINGPFFFNVDASLIKNIPFTEGTRLQLRVEAFNLTNRANFFSGNVPANFNINSTNFGRLSSQFTQGGGHQRVIQLGARFEF